MAETQASEPENAVPALSRARAVLQQCIDDGVHYGAQLSVIVGGQSVDICVGEAAPGEAMMPDHVLCWSSSVKPVMSIALAQLEERGLLGLEDPVAKHLPAFGTHGKEAVTLAHCLTHTAGLWGSMHRVDGTPEEVLNHISEQPLAKDWVPGQRCGYDSPAWYALGGVVAAVDPARRPYERYCSEEIFAPLGLDACSIGVLRRSTRRRAQGRAAGSRCPGRTSRSRSCTRAPPATAVARLRSWQRSTAPFFLA